MTDKTPQETKVTQLSPNRLATAEFAHTTWVAAPESGTPPEAMLDPKFWAHYSVHPSMQMNTGDIILVKPEDGTFFQELMVRERFRGGVKVVQLRLVQLDKAENSDEDPDYEVKYSGPNMKWRVIRKAGKVALVEGLANRDTARAWLLDHKRSQAA